MRLSNSLQSGGDSTVETAADNPSSATHVYVDGPRNRTISATATDEDDSYNANTLSVTVNDVAPSPTISGDSFTFEGRTFTLRLASRDPGPDVITRWVIDWHDGTPVQLVSGNPDSVTHVFPNGGRSTVDPQTGASVAW